MRTGDSFPHRKLTATFSSTRCVVLGPHNLTFLTLRPHLRGVNETAGVCEQAVIPVADTILAENKRRRGITSGRARFRVAAVLGPLRRPSNRLRGPGRTSGGA